MASSLFCRNFQYFFFRTWIFFVKKDFELRLTFVVLLSAFFTTILFGFFRCLEFYFLIFLPFGDNFCAVVNLQTILFALNLFQQSQFDGSATLLSDYYHLGFFHSGLCEIGHRGRVFILFVLGLPGFDHSIDLFLCRLDFIQNFRALIYCLYLHFMGNTQRLKESPQSQYSIA